jgi:hypothetical protein
MVISCASNVNTPVQFSFLSYVLGSLSLAVNFINLHPYGVLHLLLNVFPSADHTGFTERPSATS